MGSDHMWAPSNIINPSPFSVSRNPNIQPDMEDLKLNPNISDSTDLFFERSTFHQKLKELVFLSYGAVINKLKET